MSEMKCENCGNSYDKAFMIVQEGKSHVFDSFECAINVMAPKCSHCNTRIIGHGVEEDGRIYCCASCAHMEGDHEVRDRFERPRAQ